jgi:hypothetical protein
MIFSAHPKVYQQHVTVAQTLNTRKKPFDLLTWVLQQGGVVSATFRQIYSQRTSPVPTLQEASGNVIKEWEKQVYIY